MYSVLKPFLVCDQQPQDRYRVDLLKTLPWLRQLFNSDFFPEVINHKFTVYAFPAILAILFLGPQDRSHNFCLNFFWDYWWAGSFLVYPFLGRIWCSGACLSLVHIVFVFCFCLLYREC